MIEDGLGLWKWRRNEEFDGTLIDWCGVVDVDDVVGTMKFGVEEGSRDERCGGIWPPTYLPTSFSTFIATRIAIKPFKSPEGPPRTSILGNGHLSSVTDIYPRLRVDTLGCPPPGSATVKLVDDIEVER